MCEQTLGQKGAPFELLGRIRVINSLPSAFLVAHRAGGGQGGLGGEAGRRGETRHRARVRGATGSYRALSKVAFAVSGLTATNPILRAKRARGPQAGPARLRMSISPSCSPPQWLLAGTALSRISTTPRNPLLRPSVPTRPPPNHSGRWACSPPSTKAT